MNQQKVVITDFGQSCRHPCITQRKSICPRWSSPELINSRLFTPQSDIWALGVCFWELFTKGKTPYYHLDDVKKVVARLSMSDLSPKCDHDWGPITTVLEEIFQNPDKEELTA